MTAAAGDVPPAAPAPATEESATPAAAAAPAVAAPATPATDDRAVAAALSSKVNDNLLKVNTYDKYSTEKAVREEILKKRRNGLGKDLPMPASAEPTRLEDVLPGLVRIGKNPKSPDAFFSFATDEARQAAKPFLKMLKGKRSQHWYVEEGAARDTNYFQRKNERNLSEKRKLDDAGGDGKRPRFENIHDCTEPLYKMPYDEQLKQKESNLRGTLRDMRKSITGAYSRHSDNKALLARVLSNEGDEACPFEGVAPSPTQLGYRNKVEFTCGYDKEKAPAVGFLFGRTVDGSGWVESAQAVLIVSDKAKAVARAFEGVMQKLEDLKPYDKFAHAGVWRTLLVREGRADDLTTPVMLVDVQINAAKGSPEYERVAALLKETYGPWAVQGAAIEDKPYIGSLSLTVFTCKSNSCPMEAPADVLIGEACIEDVALGKRFKISPRSFFQVNSMGNEVLLNTIARYAGLGSETILVDLCCGTGTIGLSLAHIVKKVIGIDMVPSAIEDAKLNAARNNITNAEYHCGRAEDIVDRVLSSYSGNPNLIAIVDPPRSGLHNKVLAFLRSSTGLQKFVYVSCKQSSLVANCEILCKDVSNKLTGLPFKPVKATGVDLFPQVNQQELIVLFERLKTPEVEEAAAAAAAEAPKEMA